MTTAPAGIKAPSGVRPAVDDVALLLRARTKDSNGVEVGTFDDDTRPTDVQCEQQITVALAAILMRLPPIEQLPPEFMPAIAMVVTYRAALRIEKSYYPEQVRTDRSAYNELWTEYNSELEFLVTRAWDLVTGQLGARKMAMIPLQSWTSMVVGEFPWGEPWASARRDP